MIEIPGFTVELDTSSKRTTYTLTHNETQRLFRLVLFDLIDEDPASILRDKRRSGNFYPFELIPNGRLISPDAKNFVDVESSLWNRVKECPSMAAEALCQVQKIHPGLEPVLVGGGYGSRSIFYQSIDAALAAIDNAVCADVWLNSFEPVKYATLPFPRTTCTLEAKASWGNGEPPCGLSGVLQKITKAMRPDEHCVVSESTKTHAPFRIEVMRDGLEYPDNCRLLLFSSEHGSICNSGFFGFARDGMIGIADSLARTLVPRFDSPVWQADGLPAYGQSFSPPHRSADRWSIREAIAYSSDSSDKVYLILNKGSRAAVVWGRRKVGKLQSKECTGTEADDRLYQKKRSGYERLRHPSFIPDILSRLETAGLPSQY